MGFVGFTDPMTGVKKCVTRIQCHLSFDICQTHCNKKCENTFSPACSPPLQPNLCIWKFVFQIYLSACRGVNTIVVKSLEISHGFKTYLFIFVLCTYSDLLFYHLSAAPTSLKRSFEYTNACYTKPSALGFIYIRAKAKAIFTARKRSCGKVMFLHLSVILFIRWEASLPRGGVSVMAYFHCRRRIRTRIPTRIPLCRIFPLVQIQTLIPPLKYSKIGMEIHP